MKKIRWSKEKGRLVDDNEDIYHGRRVSPPINVFTNIKGYEEMQ